MKIGIDLKYIRNYAMGGNLGDELVHRNLACYLPEEDQDNEFLFYLHSHLAITSPKIPLRDNITIKKMAAFHKNAIFRNLVSFPQELYKNPVDLFHGSSTLPFFIKSPTVLSM